MSPAVFFDPDATGTTESSGTVEIGEHTAHITDISVKRDVVVKGKYLSDIFTPIYRIASGNSSGLEIKDRGIFMFKKPSEDNSELKDRKGGGNAGYKNLLDAIGKSIEELLESDRTIYRLPEISKNDALNKPVVISVYQEEFTSKRDGNIYKVRKAKLLHGWGDGKELSANTNTEDKNDEELPF